MSEALLTVENVSKSYGEKILFRDISFGIAKGQKTALIARNGAGKTSLLEIIAGNDFPDEGKVVFRNHAKIGYLSQNPSLKEDLSVMEYVFASENKFIQTIKEYESALFQIQQSNTSENQKLLNQCILEMDTLNAWDYENRIKEILSRLQINDVSKKISQLSGGERKKIALSKILIEDADLLILDEPTNHLDISMIEWLEEYLSKQNLALLLVTHDRYFLDNVCSEIIELSNQSIFKYKGNYNYFIEKKLERVFIEQQELEKTKNNYSRELEWMRRMPSARGTKAKARIDAFYALEEKARKRVDNEKVEFSVKTERIGGKILEMYNLSKKFGDHIIINDFSYTFKRGEKVGIVGRNGIGKSSFLNMIMGLLNPDAGRINRGQTIQFGYYTQEGLDEPEEIKVIDIIKKEAELIRMEDGSEISASQFLNHFGFDYSLQYTHFGSLSGGEKRKLNLLKVLIPNPNFLILDEPTNDLDLYTLEALENFLQTYKGCLLIVSHDRCFMDHIVDHLFVFEGDGLIKDYHSNYTDYLKQKQLSQKKPLSQKKEEDKIQREKPKSNKPTFKQKQELENLTNEIDDLELEKASLLTLLNENSFQSHEELETCSEQLGEIIQLIDEKTEKWIELSDLIDL